ncbi:hypothetical protein OVY01_22195 [Robbsia sp. Bb-Pol-6]|uniref:Uncharacterized protein n=1 Tax=Robbsia betulipollinis TaxID=2981849 RepID=A0ABT3ZVD3_9BURK|nr:hypothetical protein [Robbsia betulipollinis]MCY0389855.1 hypothetical protein [Robbsia betulipollinis]
MKIDNETGKPFAPEPRSPRRIAWGCVLCIPLMLAVCGGGSGNGGGNASGGSTGTTTAPQTATPTLQRILFVGDSFTHGRYTPVRTYNSGGTLDPVTGSALVYDENYGQTGARAELETGPWGGIPGIFAEFALEEGLDYDVHIEAISETSLEKNYAAASGVIDQSKWNAVVLQEISAKPLPYALTVSTVSDPAGFCSSVATIEQGVHQVAPAANVFLYETWASGDTAQTLSGTPGTSGYHASYLANLVTLSDADHNAYYSAAAHDGAIAGVAPAGDAWQRAWNEGIANPDPLVTSSLPLLWYDINATNDPAITQADLHHPSIYGAYLSGLVLFQQITGVDVRTLGAAEKAAQQLGIPATAAVRLQQVAWESVTQESAALLDATGDPCASSS